MWRATRSTVVLLRVVVLAVVVLSAGCAARSGTGASDESPGGIAEEGLAGESSIDQFERTGTVAAGGAFEDVRFAYDSDVLDPAAQSAISHNASILSASAARRVEIEGHCDERGSSEYNLALGARRARAVRDALVGMGVSSDRLSTVSYGEELPLCKESNESCWSINRRAHFVDLNP